jgi:hypothetical protein
LRQIVASLQGQVEAQLAILDQQVASSQAAQQLAQDQISGNQATSTAVASGFEDMGDGDIFVKWSTGEFSNGNQVVGFTTKCKDYSNGPGKWKGGDKLEIQNLKDDDISVTNVSIRVTSQSGGGWRGSKNWFKPSSQPNIGRGDKGNVSMVVEKWIHGQNSGPNQVQPSEDLYVKRAFGIADREAKNHTGNFELTIGTSDGGTIKKTFGWRLAKNKKSV